jgi:hypothetical protein
VIQTQTVEETEGAEEGKKQAKTFIRNQFNYSARAAQTVNNPSRVRLNLLRKNPQTLSLHHRELAALL